MIALAAVTVGCQSNAAWTPNFLKQAQPEKKQQQQKTFEDVLKHTQGDPLEGKVLAEIKGVFDPDANRFAFVTDDDRPVFVYEESDGTVKLLIVNKDGTVKQESFQGYDLKKAILNNKILYIGYKGNSVIKLNVDSFHYSEVDKSEMERARVVLDEFKLPGKETPVHSQDGFIYTQEGYIFDIKNHEYLLSGKSKKKFYEKADFAYGTHLFEIEPRLDQAINLKVIAAKGDKTAKGKTYGIHLDLHKGYNVKNIEHAIGSNGTLYLFAIGAREDNKLAVKMFEVPLRSLEEKEME
ncbi:hypothetical protein EFBL_1036 [Effusibacillus lacus]|uniref:Uncharacterized protein n=2 Tax=Effusibacillus lacus TaxID=1348429 RepID=A0A292YHW7_9BACL|nr:hypothetical protein EFBL_1036 [Effusibacillus lacus]